MLNVLLNVTLVAEELDVGTIDLHTALLAQSNVLFAAQRGESPVLADDDLLATGELVHGATESLDGGGTVGITGANTDEDLTDVYSGDDTVGLSEGTTHTSLEPISSSARQHLVDSDDVVGVSADAEMETFFTGHFDEISRRSQYMHSDMTRLLKLGNWTYLLAQIRAASRASEPNCSYSLETM